MRAIAVPFFAGLLASAGGAPDESERPLKVTASVLAHFVPEQPDFRDGARAGRAPTWVAAVSVTF